MEKLARWMEYFWIGLGVVSAGWVIYLMATEGWERNKLLVWFPVMCVAMFLYRRFMRKKMAEWAERQNDRP